MFRPQIQKTRILVILAVFNLLLFYGATQVKDDVLSRGYEEKIKAAEIMASALAELKNFRMEKGVFVDTENDPNETALVGQAFSLITTDEGVLDSKLSTLNPNFAAGIVDMFYEHNEFKSVWRTGTWNAHDEYYLYNGSGKKSTTRLVTFVFYKKTT